MYNTHRCYHNAFGEMRKFGFSFQTENQDRLLDGYESPVFQWIDGG